MQTAHGRTRTNSPAATRATSAGGGAQRIAAFASPLLICLVLSSACFAADFLALTLDGVPVDFHEGDVGAAREAARAVAFSAERLQRDVALTLDPMPAVVLARGRPEYDALCGEKMPDWSIAAALTERNRIVIDAGRAVPATAADANLTVFHEVVHLALARLERNRKDRLPRWLHEGVATWLSGTRHLRGDRSDFDLAAAHDSLLPLSELTDSFPVRANQADLAYVQSEAFVAHLVNSHGIESLRLLFRSYGEGGSFDDAFRAAFGMTVSGAETEWRSSLSRSYGWFSTVVGTLSFWGAMALLTLGVYLIVARRARKQQEEWDREDSEWRVVPDEPDPDEEPDDEEDQPWEDDEDDHAWRRR